MSLVSSAQAITRAPGIAIQGAYQAFPLFQEPVLQVFATGYGKCHMILLLGPPATTGFALRPSLPRGG